MTKKVSVVGRCVLRRWPLGLSLLCAWSAASPAQAQSGSSYGYSTPGSWVLVRAEFKGKFTSQSTRTGGQPVGYLNEKWERSITPNRYPTAYGFSTPLRSDPTGSPGGKMVASLEGRVMVHLEWQGSGRPDKICYIRLNELYPLADAGALQSDGPSWDISVDNGVSTPLKKTNSSPVASDSSGMAYDKVEFPSTVEKVIVIDTGSALKVDREIDFPLKANSTLTVLRGGDRADARVSMAAGVEMSNYGVHISSDIETSYKKQIGAASFLPDEYKLRDATTGALTNAPNPAIATQLEGQETPNDAGDDVWKLQCVRDGKGSMTVESAAQWLTSPNLMVDSKLWQGWLAGTKFYANVKGFTPSTYAWTKPPTSRSPQIPAAINDLNPVVPTVETPYYGILLGSQVNASDLVRTSTVGVTVTAPYISPLSDSYSVHWHTPYEKVRDLADGVKKKDIYWMSNAIEPNAAPILKAIPAKEFDFEATIDTVSVIGKAFGMPDEISDIMAAFKAVVDIAQWGDKVEEITSEGTALKNDPYAFRSAIALKPENISDMTVEKRDDLMIRMAPPTEEQLDSLLWDYDCFVGRVRRHHKANVLADHYNNNGYHSSNHILSHEVYENPTWEYFYTPKQTTPVPPDLGDDIEIPPSYNRF